MIKVVNMYAWSFIVTTIGLSFSFSANAAMMKCQKVKTGIHGGEPVYSTVCWWENDQGGSGGSNPRSGTHGGGSGSPETNTPANAISPTKVAEVINTLNFNHDLIQAYLDKYGSLISNTDFNKLRRLASELSSIAGNLANATVITDALINQQFGKASIELVALLTGVAVSAAIAQPMASILFGAATSALVQRGGEEILIYLRAQYKVLSYNYSHIPTHQIPCALAGLPLFNCNRNGFEMP